MGEYRELLLGCGNRRDKQMWPEDLEGRRDWSDLTTIDIDPNCKPDIELDLERVQRGERLPFEDSTFDEIHAYHLLEHVGNQGDYRAFFTEFSEFWRVVKPGGSFCGIVPDEKSIWVWGDPGHRRFFHPAWLTYLDQDEYTKQVGRTAFADYRRVYRADWRMVNSQVAYEQFAFRLIAEKPSRISV